MCAPALAERRCVGACGFGRHPRLQAWHPTACGEPGQSVAGSQRHQLVFNDTKAALSPGQAAFLGLTSAPAEGKRRGVSHPGPNGEEEKGREGWGSTSSSGEVRITTHPCAPLHHEVRNKTSKFTSGGSRKSHWDMHTQRKALSPEG